MKRIVVLLTALIIGLSMPVVGEIVYKDGKFVQVDKKTKKQQHRQTKYPYERDGKLLPTFITENGRVYAIVISKRTGKPYKVYMPENDCRRIANEMGIPYKERE